MDVWVWIIVAVAVVAAVVVVTLAWRTHRRERLAFEAHLARRKQEEAEAARLDRDRRPESPPAVRGYGPRSGKSQVRLDGAPTGGSRARGDRRDRVTDGERRRREDEDITAAGSVFAVEPGVPFDDDGSGLTGDWGTAAGGGGSDGGATDSGGSGSGSDGGGRSSAPDPSPSYDPGPSYSPPDTGGGGSVF